MQQELSQTIALLARTPPALDALLRGLPAQWTLRNEGHDTWSVQDVVAHLIYAERVDWMPRIKTILQYGDTRPFEPFDRLGHVEESRGKTLEQLLDEFARIRSVNLEQLKDLNLRSDQFELQGQHPALGTVTLSELLATWAVHDMTHLHQISRVLAHQYRDAVGPWGAYLGVLRCGGHSLS